MTTSKPTCPHCAKPLPAETMRAVASYLGKPNAKYGALGGRPRTDAERCACGAMTLKRALARGHKCG